MKRVLLVGLEPSTVDCSDPALPPGITAEKIHAGIKFALADITKRGRLPESCLINSDETAVSTVDRRLSGEQYDCVVVGAGLRLPPNAWRCSKRLSTRSTVARRRQPSQRSTLSRKIPARPRVGSETKTSGGSTCLTKPAIDWAVIRRTGPQAHIQPEPYCDPCALRTHCIASFAAVAS